MKSYRNNLRNRFQKQVKEITDNHQLQELVLVLDVNTAVILTHLFRLTEMVSMKINYIERLQKKRKKLNQHALYFITPNQESILNLSKDFPDKKSQPQYRRVHVLFSSFLDQSNLKIIATNPFLMKRIAKNSIKQFYSSARVIAENLVNIGVSYLQYGFSKESESQRLRREKIAQGLIQYIANFDEINTVKIYYKKSPNFVCERMAHQLERTVKSYLGILVKNKSTNLKKNAKDITYLLLDRSVDPITPLLHYFTYQSLLFDLFQISMAGKADLKDKEGYSYQQIQNESYEKYRYRHISEALSKLPEALDYEKDKLQGIKTKGTENFSVEKMSERINDLRDNIERLKMIWNKFQQLNIADLSELQLSLATGLTGSASNTSSSKLLEEVMEIIKKPGSSQIKIRLALLCLCCIKLSKKDYMELIDLFEGEDKQILKNMNALGVSYDGSTSKSTKTITREQQNIAKERMQRTGMPSNRYTTIIQLVVPLFVRVLSDPLESCRLDNNIFGQICCSIFKDERESNRFDVNKFGIVMVGGMSWTEASALRSIGEIQNSVILTDSMYNPKEYLSKLSKINSVE